MADVRKLKPFILKWEGSFVNVLEVSADGIVGKSTIAAINAYQPQAELFGRIKQARYDFIDRICEKRTANNKFKNGWRNRIKDLLGHPVEALRTVAAEASALIAKYGNPTAMAYNEEYGRLHNLLQDLTAFALVNGEDAYTTFIDHVNVIIDQANAVLAGRSTRAEKKKGSV